MTTLQFRVASPREAHDTAVGLYQGVMKPHTRTGAAGVITWQTESSWLRTKLRAAFHGPVLKAISEQVWFTDEASGHPLGQITGPIEVEGAVVGLQPQIVRIFFNSSDFSVTVLFDPT